MNIFNNGRPYHGSEAVSEGKLEGATGQTDYFFFFCPKCPDREIVRLLDYEIRRETADNPANEAYTKKASRGFILALRFYCERCQHEDFFKIDNLGPQQGAHKNLLALIEAIRS